VFITSFAAPMFATNCWIIADAPGGECVIVDPGMPDVSDTVAMIVNEHKLKPVATIITHGHLDHTFSIVPVANGYDIPAYIHSEDRALLLHPERAHGPEFLATLSAMDFIEPNDVRELRHGAEVEMLGMKFQAIHAPGHTRGSLMFTVNQELLISGDVLFAGAIGRTDLPSGSSQSMQETLINKVLTLSDDLRVLPGHGPDTNIGHERRTNPYLIDAAKKSGKR
jgi:glyoxylase-like metal-dependent hydrolase (beta-lactamase superfamily II)